uniref:probable 2-ketogluconate reductase n=1 Tax=Myxine glutinosa TaxID=7769 RepID=UPI00358E3471
MDKQPHLLLSPCPFLEMNLNSILETFQNHFCIVWFSEFIKNSKQLGEKIVGILTFSEQTYINKKLLDLLPNLKVVSVFGVGVDHLDLTLIRSYGVKICNLPGIVTSPTADMAMALLLASARNIVSGVQQVKNSEPTNPIIADTAVEITGSIMGILGMGTIGLAVAKRARGFDMTILYHNRKRRPVEEEQEVGATFCPYLLDMLTQIDFLVVCVDLNSSSTKMIGEQEFRAMKPSATVVNIARGLVIDQDALVTALSEGWIRGAALDVTYPEPLPRGHPLLHLNNVIITPHSGTDIKETFEKMANGCFENTLAGVEDRPFPLPIKV